MQEIRIGIIGAGVISHRHMTVYKQIPGVRVVAVCEVNPDKLKKWSEKYNIPDIYTDYREFLKRDDIDAVDVCVHNNLHASMAIAVMRAGFHCYCEKPMAGSYADAKLMYEVAQETQRKLAIQISSIFSCQTRIAKEMIARGELGNIYHVRTVGGRRRGRPGVDMTMLSPDFYSKEIGGHGPVFDVGVYNISQMIFLLGMPELESVYGCAYQGIACDNDHIMQGRKYEVEDFGVAIARYKGNISMEIEESWAMNMDSLGDSYILGSSGGLKINNIDGYGGPMIFEGKFPEGFKLPELKFYGMHNGREVDIDLRPNENDQYELNSDPKTWYYRNNQTQWIGYLRGDIDECDRYDTPRLAMNTALVSDGLFISNQLGRSVTADEIKSLSVSTAVRHQKTPWGIFDYDL